jgi:hypothetical protein
MQTMNNVKSLPIEKMKLIFQCVHQTLNEIMDHWWPPAQAIADGEWLLEALASLPSHSDSTHIAMW